MSRFFSEQDYEQNYDEQYLPKVLFFLHRKMLDIHHSEMFLSDLCFQATEIRFSNSL